MKKDEIMPFATTWVDLEIIILREVSQKEKNKYHDITYIWSLKYGTNEILRNWADWSQGGQQQP